MFGITANNFIEKVADFNIIGSFFGSDVNGLVSLYNQVQTKPRIYQKEFITRELRKGRYSFSRVVQSRIYGERQGLSYFFERRIIKEFD